MRTSWVLSLAFLSVSAMGCGKLLDGLKKGKDAGAEADPATAATAPSASASAAATAEPTASAVASAAPDEPLVLPGSCVDPTKDAKKHYASADFDSNDVDLDGDGKKDKILHAALHGMNDPYLLYVMRGTCGHFVGEVQSSAAPTVSGKKSKGLKSFETTIKNPCLTPCGCFDQSIPFYFNGKSYVASKEKQIPTNDPCDAGAPKADAGAAAGKDAGAPKAVGPLKVKDKVLVEWKGQDWPATIIQVMGPDKYKIHYDNYDSSWDEVVGPARIKGRR